MRIFLFVFMFLISSVLTGCDISDEIDDNTEDISQSCTEDEHFDEASNSCVLNEVEEDGDDVVVITCEEGYELIDSVCEEIFDINNFEFDELPVGQLDALLIDFNRMYYEHPDSYEFVVNTDTSIHTSSFDLGYGIINTLSSLYEIDLVDFYIHNHITLGNQLSESQFIFIKDGHIVHAINIDDRIVETVLTEDASYENQLAVLEMLASYNETNPFPYFGNFVKETNLEYTAQMTYIDAYDYFGVEFMSQFEEYENVDFSELYFDITLTFDDDFGGYTQIIYLKITGDLDDVIASTEITVTETFSIESFDHYSLEEMGYRKETCESIESVTTEATLNEMTVFDYYPDRQNWVRYYLEPGYYVLQAAIEAPIGEKYISVYTEAYEEIYDGYPLIIEEAGYYYLDLNPSSSNYDYTYIAFGLYVADILDISETIITDDSGIITGHSEGSNDYNTITLEANGTERYIRFDLDVINSNDDLRFLTYNSILAYYESNYYCDDFDGCIYKINSYENLLIELKSNDELDYTIEYHILNESYTTDDISDTANMLDISSYDGYNPIVLSNTQREAYFKVTFEESGTWQINFWKILNEEPMLECEVYDISGTFIDNCFYNEIYYEADTYIIKVKTEDPLETICLFYPTLFDRN